MRLIDADALGNRMYHESFEKDSDLQRWDGGCWIRYKLFEQVLRAAPTIDLTHPTPSNTLGALDCVSRQAAIDGLKDRYYKYGRFAKLEELVWVIEELPSVQPATLTEDDKETIRIHLSAFKESLCNQHRWNEAEEYEELISRLLSTPSVYSKLEKNSKELENKNGELISRQAAIDEIDEWIKAFRENGHKESAADACLIQDGIIQLPSAQPRKGKWIYGENDGQDGWYCSECSGFIPWYYDFYGLDNIDFIADFKSCPFCRAEMLTYTGKAELRGDEE